VQVGIGLGVRVLHRDVRSELDMLAERMPKRFVMGQPCLVGCGHVQFHEPLALLFK
jgi:hypothetical protein